MYYTNKRKKFYQKFLPCLFQHYSIITNKSSKPARKKNIGKEKIVLDQ